MIKKPIPKAVITPEMKNRQLQLRKFLKETGTEHKELRPIGFSINTLTIPIDKIDKFLKIANSIKI